MDWICTATTQSSSTLHVIIHPFRHWWEGTAQHAYTVWGTAMRPILVLSVLPKNTMTWSRGAGDRTTGHLYEGRPCSTSEPQSPTGSKPVKESVSSLFQGCVCIRNAPAAAWGWPQKTMPLVWKVHTFFHSSLKLVLMLRFSYSPSQRKYYKPLKYKLWNLKWNV